MAEVLAFPKPCDYKSDFRNLVDVIANSKRSLARFHVVANGKSAGVSSGNDIVLSPDIHGFSILEEWIGFYRDRIGISDILSILDKIRAERVYSDHIVDKLRSFVKTGVLHFSYEAQFPPILIRRIEKNVYYATSFVMAVTRLIIQCHHQLAAKGITSGIHIQHMEKCDRCSLRLLQNLSLAFKAFPMEFNFFFTKKMVLSSSPEKYEDYRGVFVQSRIKCFSKLFSVFGVSGITDELCSPQKIENILNEIDFSGAFTDLLDYINLEERDQISDIALDLLYKSNYEKLYLLLHLLQTSNHREYAENKSSFLKISILAKCYNYLFEEALREIDGIYDHLSESDKSYGSLIKGLILLKKFKKSSMAQEEFLTALEMVNASSLSHSRKAIESGFLKNACNLTELMGALKLSDRTLKHDAIQRLIFDEHDILDRLLECFVSAGSYELHDGSTLLEFLFIISTVMENISQLCALNKDFSTIYELMASYEYILTQTSERIADTEYKRSFIISFSHALLPMKIRRSRAQSKMGNYQGAYDTTLKILKDADLYDVTGDYRGFALHSHAINCARLSRKQEAATCLVNAAKLYLGYNEPYMVKVAVNSLKEFLQSNDPDLYDYLVEQSIIDETFTAPDESFLIASSPVDLENTMISGMEGYIQGRKKQIEYVPEEFRLHDIKATYRMYGFWRQMGNETNQA